MSDAPSYYLAPGGADVYAWMRTRPAHGWARWGTAGERQRLDALYGALLTRAIRLPYKGQTAVEIAEDARKLAVEATMLAEWLEALDQAGEGQRS